MLRSIVFLILLFLLGNGVSCAVAPVDTNWPLAIDSPAGRVEIFQPQPDSLMGDKLSARAAVSMLPAGASEPTFGAIWFDARVATDRDDRTATIQDVVVKDVRLPEATGPQQQQFAQALKDQVSKLAVTVSLDQLMTSLDIAQKETAAAEQLRTDPPKILFSNVPATLVTINGPPKLQQVDQSPIMHVVNTPFLILFDPPSKRYFLKAGAGWVTAPDATGSYEDAPNVPRIVTDVATRLQQPRATNPPAAPQAATPPAPPAQPTAPPRIIVATEPTELIVTNGQPTYTPLPGNDLLYMSNTQSDVFVDVASQENYVVLAGRWYRAKSLQGPWEYVPADHLPTAFSKIPEDSPKADALAFVAGTQQANEAVLDASIPQTSAIRRDAGASLRVTYDGAPKFQPIQGTAMTYAVNTSEAVIDVNGTYYCCSEAVWYQAPSPEGPWTVCVNVPQEIYTIPPSSPLYNVRYVYVYDYNPDTAYVGYLPGYTGSYVYGPTVVYGTDYDYPDWYGSVYYPGPFTWGYGACFDPWNDCWDYGLGFDWSPLWFWHDGFHHHFFGPGGFRDHRHFDDHRFANMHGRDFDDHHNVYHRLEDRNRNVISHSDTRFAHLPSHRENNVFAGHDGAVYRRTDQGWEARQNRSWTQMRETPEAHVMERAPAPDRAPAFETSPSPGRGLEADHFARERGASRASGFSNGGFSGGELREGGGGGGFQGGGGGGFHGGGGFAGHGGGGGGHR